MVKQEEIYTWEQISKSKSGTVFLDKFDEGIRFIIMKGGSSLCAYIGIPIDHPLAGFDYDSIPIECHGGLTFTGEGGKNAEGDECWPRGYWWYGWDYAHSGDYVDYYDTYKDKINSRDNNKKWLVKMVEDDSWNTIYEFKKLMKLAEQIVGKKYKIVPTKPKPRKKK